MNVHLIYISDSIQDVSTCMLTAFCRQPTNNVPYQCEFLARQAWKTGGNACRAKFARINQFVRSGLWTALFNVHPLFSFERKLSSCMCEQQLALTDRHLCSELT